MILDTPFTNTPFRPGKVLCIGRNYAKHAAEMQSDVPETPMVFLKPATALVGSGGSVVLPDMTEEVHHEVELVVLIGKKCKAITEADALSYVAGYAAGLDMTARDLQAAAKKKGHPWSVAKGFDTFAPVGAFVAADDVGDVQDLAIELYVNGDMRQQGTTRDMIFPVAQLIAYCSSIFTLEPGDLLYTGTPEGVRPVHPGDELIARLSRMPELRVRVERDG